MIGQALDKLISVISPTWGLRRVSARATLQGITALTGGNAAGGYQASKLNRFTKSARSGTLDENSQPRADITNLRTASWQLFRNNPQAKKICRTLGAKVIGLGMQPQSEAKLPDGTTDIQFRNLSRTLWSSVQELLDYRGRPGRGGQHASDLAKTALRGVILGGEVLFRIRSRTPEPGQDSTLPNVSIQLIHADRLLDQPVSPIPAGNSYFAGIELDANEQRVAYHVSRFHPGDPRAATSQTGYAIPAKDICHIYISEDIDQLRGVPWFSAALLKMRDTGDYEYNELKAAAVAACVVLGYRRSSGQTQFGVNQPDDWDLTDADGNKLTAMQPGMLLDLGRNGEIQGFNPQRPNANAGEFIAHMLRSQATAVPGVKGTTLTGDYRNSSFSSERSADNDIWPEIEELQAWFSRCFYQPIYEAVLTSAVVNGWFGGVLDTQDFLLNRANYVSATWQGPVSRSINPVDDAKASRERIRNGQSSPQIEAALLGRNWQEIVLQVADYIDFCEDSDIPESVVAQTLGIDQQDEPLLGIGEEPEVTTDAADATDDSSDSADSSSDT